MNIFSKMKFNRTLGYNKKKMYILLFVENIHLNIIQRE